MLTFGTKCNIFEYMIKNRVSIIMGERKMKIAEVAKITNLSYNAVSNIYYNKTSNIDFETLDKLCYALECDTNDIFKYIKE